MIKNIINSTKDEAYKKISSFVLEKTKSELINTFGVSIDVRRFSSHCDNISDYLYNELLSSDYKAKYFYVNSNEFKSLRSNISFNIKLRERTYMFVRYKEIKDDGNTEGVYTFTFLGKHAYYEFYKFQNKMTNHTFDFIRITDPMSRSNGSIQPLRPLKTIYMDNKYDLFRMIKKRINDKSEFCNKHGLLNKVGILLYGEPGTGKTSFAKMIATELKINNIILVSMSNIESSMNNINQYSGLNPSVTNLFLFEDIDILYGKREDNIDIEEKKNTQLLLQLLDGVMSVNNSIYIATTNNKDSLDEAIIRKGRFDIEIEMNGISEKEALRMIRDFGCEGTYILPKDTKFPVNPSKLQADLLEVING